MAANGKLIVSKYRFSNGRIYQNDLQHPLSVGSNSQSFYL